VLTCKQACNDGIRSILIIDDDQYLLEVLVEAFKLYGLDVIKAKNGIDGWHLFESQPTDIVLTDINMPGLDGEELSYRIRDHSPDTVIAVMTGGFHDIGRKLFNDKIADYYFTKPFSISFACKAVTERLRQQDLVLL